MKSNLSVLTFGLVILAINLVLINASSSEDLSSPSNPLVDNKARLPRRHCGVRTFKLLMLICTNDLQRNLKFPSVERQDLKDINYFNDQLLNTHNNFETFKRSQEPMETNELLNDQQFNLKKLVDYNTLQDSIPDVHVHNNPSYHRMKRSLIRDCCYRACTLKELENLC